MRGLGAWRNIRLWLSALIFVLTVAALIGGQSLAESLRVNRPLEHELKSIAGVRDYTLEQTDGGVCLDLQLSKVKDLGQTLQQAVTVTERYQGEQVVEIRLKDHRQGLEEAYYNLSFSLEEALATGRYTQLQSELKDLSAQFGLGRARIYLDSRFIYVQLEKGKSYLYEAVVRPAAGVSPDPAEGGVS